MTPSLCKRTLLENQARALDRLNSLNSPEEIVRAIAADFGRKALSIRVAQRIVNRRQELGSFRDWPQLATVPGIGAKKLSSIIHALQG